MATAYLLLTPYMPESRQSLESLPILNETIAQEVYNDWRLRGRIEQGYRFDQEQGLDVEDVRVHSLERMRRIFALVLVAAQFVFYLMKRWPPKCEN
jgi:hypothetical protein